MTLPNENSNGPGRVNAKLGHLKEPFKQACEQNDETMTEVLRRSARRYIERHGDLDDLDIDELPEDPTLRDSYQVLRRLRHPDRHTTSADIAKSEISQNVGVKDELVKRNVLRPLESRGLIEPRGGQIVVYDPDRPAEPDHGDRDISHLLVHKSRTETGCTGHHYDESGTCLKCGHEREGDESPDVLDATPVTSDDEDTVESGTIFDEMLDERDVLADEVGDA